MKKRIITWTVVFLFLYNNIVSASDSLQLNSAFDSDPRNNEVRTEMIEYYSVKSDSSKVYREARLAQELYKMGYLEGTGEDNKYIRPAERLLKLWEDAMAKRLLSVFIRGYLIKFEKMKGSENWEISYIFNYATGGEEYYIFGVYQRTEIKAVMTVKGAPSAVKRRQGRKIPDEKAGLAKQILIAFRQLGRPTLRELMEFIEVEFGTNVDKEDVLTRIGFLNFRRRQAGERELVLASEKEVKKRTEAKPEESEEPVKTAKPIKPVKSTKPVKPPKPSKPAEPSRPVTPAKPPSPPSPTVEPSLSDLVKKDKGELLRKLAELNWNLKKFYDYIGSITGRKKPHFSELLKELDLVDEFRTEALRIFRQNKGRIDKTSEYFGITSTTLWVLVVDFGIDLRLPESEGQKGFNRIILIYAQELKKGTPIEGIKEKLGPLIEGFSGWEADAEEGEIKTRFMGSNKLVIGLLENKRYILLFEWHDGLGLVVVLREPGRDIGEDIIYDLSNCRGYDETGHYWRIYALSKGKRKEVEFNGIIERYARLLREGKSPARIKEVLSGQIEKFGSWEIEVAGQSFVIAPIYGIYNALVFGHLPSGKLFLKLQWDDLNGLLVAFGKGKDSREEDLIFDVSPFSDFDESATRDKPNNLFAKKIGVRDELNRARLNKVILRCINLLRAGRPLEQIKEEMSLLGGWRKTIESNSFVTAPVINKILAFQDIPKGTYKISLEWLDSVGLVVVFHLEGDDIDNDLLYDINLYKDYNESAEKAAHISARKLGVRGMITLVYLERIILKYIDYLREGKPLDEIKRFLAEDIERFGIRGLELKAKSFTVSPVRLNYLLFLGLTPGRYYISVFWYDEYGLLVGLKPQDENVEGMKTQIYDVSPYRNYSISERHQLCAGIVTSKIIRAERQPPEKGSEVTGTAGERISDETHPPPPRAQDDTVTEVEICL